MLAKVISSPCAGTTSTSTSAQLRSGKTLTESRDPATGFVFTSPDGTAPRKRYLISAGVQAAARRRRRPAGDCGQPFQPCGTPRRKNGRPDVRRSRTLLSYDCRKRGGSLRPAARAETSKALTSKAFPLVEMGGLEPPTPFMRSRSERKSKKRRSSVKKRKH